MSPRAERLLTVAHRHGNTVQGLRQALDAGVDLVEADVHTYRGVLEVRHHKAVGPAHLWDKGELVRRREFERVECADLLAELGGDHRLMLDLKGIQPTLAPATAEVLRVAAPGVALTVCTQHWWMLDAFDPTVRRVLSAGSRRGLWRLRRRLAGRPAYGASVRLDLLSPTAVAEIRAGTRVLLTWPVDSPAALRRARELGVDGVISKDLDLLARLSAGRC